MKKNYAVLLFSILLILTCGFASCSSSERDPAEVAEELRAYFENAPGYSARVVVEYNHGDTVSGYTFGYSRAGAASEISVISPADMEGIHATVEDGSSMLTFDDIILDVGAIQGSSMSPIRLLPSMGDIWAQGISSECGYESLDGVRCLVTSCRSMTAGEELTYRTWFDAETFKPLAAELYTGETMAAKCRFQSFDFN